MSVFRTDFLKNADAALGGPLCRLIGRFNRFERQPPYPRVTPGDLRRVLVIRPGGLGDMVQLLPALRALRTAAPGAELLIVCESRNLDVLRLAGLGDLAVTYDAHPFRVLRRIAAGSHDVCIDTEQFHHFSSVLGRLSHAGVRIGFKINPVRNPLYTHLVDYAPDAPESEQFLRLLSPLGIQAADGKVAGVLAEASIPISTTVRSLLEATGGAAGGVVALHPGGSAKYKQWASARFAELALRLHEERGLPCIVMGDASDRQIASQVERAVLAGGGRAGNAAGVTSLLDAAALLRASALFVGTDSGLAHLAVALDRKSVVLFGATDSRKWGVQDGRRAVVRGDVSCAPCCIFGYHRPCRTIACMARIETADVLSACQGVLRA
jgi:ADP-heptose:LPS heptosyltransferase